MGDAVMPMATPISMTKASAPPPNSPGVADQAAWAQSLQAAQQDMEAPSAGTGAPDAAASDAAAPSHAAATPALP
ncbi:hypothetical protein MXAZACID_09326, partial [Acidocella sp. MX-AZ02]